ncbi:Sua5 YciO YrdC YwlC family protein [Campylobacter upsaliensis]|nr:Sua5 YciO YrdC YwlC family protein [Campylobacter upsaliensis]EAI7390646.1 Sua5 YciO YrdC YwlC family protein [Campylobacter upsaliensis]EAJ5221084.1 Sua5 YciO YrdC YwlC family protein [Campylobacter upsaliensis]EAJ7265780.1 Sua5 YciO YrdC YwlC family protein [Campylobacter upsaliensis]EAL3925068.1 Sua5 YciO YrdC YwlC family protein [Campylobacter upsaliensis]
MLMKIYLCQTDTTAGFLSKNKALLNKLKNRPLNTPCLITTARLSTLLRLTRVPKTFKNLVRKAQKTTFIYPNQKALRVVKNGKHASFLAKHNWLYSSSANEHKKPFKLKRALNLAKKYHIKIIDQNLHEANASKIFKLSRSKMRKMR